MKYFKLLITPLVLAFTLIGCEDEVSNEMAGSYPQNYDIEYKIRQVVQYDPVNINGIDVSDKIDFFNSIRFALHYKEGKITHFSYSNGDAPFSPFNFEAEMDGEVACEFDEEVTPNELRIKGTDHVVAYFRNGEFIMPFQLDCSAINYRYTFSSLTESDPSN